QGARVSAEAWRPAPGNVGGAIKDNRRRLLRSGLTCWRRATITRRAGGHASFPPGPGLPVNCGAGSSRGHGTVGISVALSSRVAESPSWGRKPPPFVHPGSFFFFPFFRPPPSKRTKNDAEKRQPRRHEASRALHPRDGLRRRQRPPHHH